MLLKGVRVKEDVVKIGSSKQVQMFLETVVDKVFQGGRGISVAEGHYRVL